MTPLPSIKANDSVLSLAIAFGSLLTVLTLYVLARHHFLSIRPETKLVYAGKLTETQEGVAWHLDQAISGTRQLSVSAGPIVFRAPRSAPLELRGWMADIGVRAPVLRVVVRTDFGPPIRALYGASRPDVAAAVCAACTNTGMEVDFPAKSISAGAHNLRFTAVRADGSALYISPPVAFVITK